MKKFNFQNSFKNPYPNLNPDPNPNSNSHHQPKPQSQSQPQDQHQPKPNPIPITTSLQPYTTHIKFPLSNHPYQTSSKAFMSQEIKITKINVEFLRGRFIFLLLNQGSRYEVIHNSKKKLILFIKYKLFTSNLSGSRSKNNLSHS